MSNTATMPATKPKWCKPKSFDTNLIVIGGGSAGLVTAYIAAAVKAKVTLIEKHKLGGDCLNTGCVPSKALISITRLLAKAAQAKDFGLTGMTAEFNFADVMEHVQSIIKQIEPHDSAERYQSLGVDVIEGEAKILSPWEVEIISQQGKQIMTTLAIVISTGAKPLVPPIPGLAEMDYLTSDTIWNQRELPPRLLVLGGGPIGCELAQCYARLGSQVSLIEMAPRLLLREDPEASALVLKHFEQEGISVLLSHKAQQFKVVGGQKILTTIHENKTLDIAFDAVLLALGRKPNITGFGLEELGVTLSPTGTLQVDGFLATNYPNIFACGDVAGPYQFTHTAAHQAWYAAVNALFGNIKRFRADYSVIPWATFTEPEVARVGLNELEAKERNIAYETSWYDLADLDRAIADNAAHGFVKVLTIPGKDKILGVTIAGEHAADLIAEFVLAMKHGIGLNKILGTIHIYPTLAEANKYAAGVWKLNHQPLKLLAWLQRYHAWRIR
jgi:pyruvate/2-oxoglutarate dehydrogenase complex dihydrolipoamide dehydrogenase (E3) component